jgi:phosphomannomutase/phosphoglucomutase
MMLFAADVLTRNPGAEILYDVKCTPPGAVDQKAWRRAADVQDGHSLVKAKLRETGAPLGGEMSGHIFKDRWYGFDDGLYAGARMLEILTREADPSALLNSAAVGQHAGTAPAPEGRRELRLMDMLRRDAEFPGNEQIITIDGLRVEYADGFGLARSSNTTPVIVMRFEAETPAALARIQGQFKSVILPSRTRPAVLTHGQLNEAQGALNILLVRVSSLGDVLHNLPMVADIARHFPDANIDWVVEEGLSAWCA